MATVQERLNNAANMAQSALPIVDDIMPLSPADELEQLKSQYEGNPFSYGADPRRNLLEQQISEQDRLQREQQYTAQRDQHKSRSERGREGMEQITSLVGAGEMDEAYKAFEQLPFENMMMLAVTPGIGQAISTYEAQHFAPEALKSMHEGRYMSAAGSGLIAALGAVDVGLSAVPYSGAVKQALTTPVKGILKMAENIHPDLLKKGIGQFFGINPKRMEGGEGILQATKGIEPRTLDVHRETLERIQKAGGKPNQYVWNPSTNTREVVPFADGSVGYPNLKTLLDPDAPKFGIENTGAGRYVLNDSDPLLNYNRANVGESILPTLAPIQRAERTKIHNQIKGSILGDVQPIFKGEQPIVIVMGGAPATGKGTIKNVMANRGVYNPTRFVDMDPDAFKILLPEYRAIQQTGDSRAAFTVHNEGNEIFHSLFDEITMPGNNQRHLILDKTMSDLDDMGLIDVLNNRGYEVFGVGAHVPFEEMINRATSRALGGGRDLPANILLEKGFDFANNFDALIGKIDNFVLLDNMEQPFKIGAKSSGQDVLNVFDTDVLNELLLQRKINTNIIDTKTQLHEALELANQLGIE
jgi:predicted ABC-type ATPase